MATYMTKQRKLLLDFLHSHPDEKLSATEISNSLEGGKISISAVYRNLSELENEGKVRLCHKDGSKEVYYQYIHEEKCKGKLHLSCTTCEKITHVSEEVANIIFEEIVKTELFDVDNDKTILYGVCKTCKHKLE